jgi:hypothetical protein
VATGIITTAIALASLIMTCKYVRLTRSIAESTSNHLAASLQPVVSLSIEKTDQISETASENGTYTVRAKLLVQNLGLSALKIKRLYVVVQRWNGIIPSREYTIEHAILRNTVINPKGMIADDRLLVDLKSKEDKGCTLSLDVECSDMSELKTHLFSQDAFQRLHHSVEG